MTSHLDDTRLDTTLRTLDPADPDLTPEQTDRKDELLRTLLATDPTATPHRTVVPLRRPARRVLRWAIPAAAAAGIVGLMTLSGGPGGGDAAYASWTPGPVAVDGETRATAETACREGLADDLERMREADPAGPPSSTAQDFRTVAAERRGNFLLVAMAADDGSTSTCFFDAAHPDRVQGAGGGIATTASPRAKPLAAGEIETTGPGLSSGPEGTYAYTQGRVGRDVTGVTVHSEGRSVTATVSNGWFAAWWPATWIGPNAASPTITYDVTRRDGSVAKGVRDSVLTSTDLGPTQIGDVARGGGAGDGGPVHTVTGHAGSEVTAVVVHAGPQPVTATVSQGVFYAEFPDDGSEPTLSYDVVLKDGRTLRDQPPVGDGRG